MKPKEVKKAIYVLGACGNDLKELMTPYEDIPEEYQRYRSGNKFVDITTKWFYKGLPEETDYLPKEGIDIEMALKHLVSILKSFEPKHEHKMACVSYLLSEWFDDIIIPEEKNDET
jgi:hypothetical protein